MGTVGKAFTAIRALGAVRNNVNARTVAKSKVDLTPSLFDLLDDQIPADVAEDVADELDDWIEIAESVFVTWSHALQLHYCWRRDLDSALRCSVDDDASFYLQRAALYKTRFEGLMHASRETESDRCVVDL